jgi:hypothetical protein
MLRSLRTKDAPVQSSDFVPVDKRCAPPREIQNKMAPKDNSHASGSGALPSRRAERRAGDGADPNMNEKESLGISAADGIDCRVETAVSV